MRPAAELLECQPRLEKRTGCGMADILAEDGEGLPEREGLEGEDDLRPTLLRHPMNQLEVTSEQVLFHHIAW